MVTPTAGSKGRVGCRCSRCSQGPGWGKCHCHGLTAAPGAVVPNSVRHQLAVTLFIPPMRTLRARAVKRHFQSPVVGKCEHEMCTLICENTLLSVSLQYSQGEVGGHARHGSVQEGGVSWLNDLGCLGWLARLFLALTFPRRREGPADFRV